MMLSPGTGSEDGPGRRHGAQQGPALAAAMRGAGHSLSQPGLRGDADALWGASAAQDADGRAAAAVLGGLEAEGAQQQPQVEQDAGPAGGHLHPEGRPAAVREGGLQHRVLVAGGRGQALGVQGMLTWGIPAPAAARLSRVPAAACPWAHPTSHRAPQTLARLTAAHGCPRRGCGSKLCGSAGAEPCTSPARQLWHGRTEPMRGAGWGWWVMTLRGDGTGSRVAVQAG